MKKALSAAMAAGMTAVMLAGCGSSASSAAESTAPAESTLCRRLHRGCRGKRCLRPHSTELCLCRRR